MRQKIKNSITVRVKGMNLNNCTDLKFYVSQNDISHEYTPTVSENDNEVMIIEIPKSDAMHFKRGKCKWQVALTDPDGYPRSHDPVVTEMGELIWEAGYGS